ncbi:hypothetical protein [Streptomyces cacaoi]|uniref:hypothetical protein n=1 Tax=Streptomyces cacaoi TaxID=1898 RepID=UPI00260ED0E9|nr:hypothetical protein [Streptomyces cacaoi]
MQRHVIAPSRFFSQVPNDLIRHPRLSANAVRLLLWQLSLPDGADEPLSRTAQRASIGKVAFQQAKRQLRAEHYLFEWRRQGERGRWITVQLIANTPLTAEEARAALAPPTGSPPAPGAPTDRPAAPQPREDPGDNTSHPTAAAATSGAVPAAAPREAEAEAEALLLSLGRAAPFLAMAPRKARRWAPFAVRWLGLGMTADEVRSTLISGLESARSPLGALRWRLEHALPRPSEPVGAAPAPSPRVTRMRECAGTHIHPRLFLPDEDERLCADCRSGPAETPRAGGGLAAFRAARAADTARGMRAARA